MKDLKKVIDEVKSLKDANFKPSDDAILISATNIFLNKRITPTTGKTQTTSNKPRGSKFVIKNPTDPATDKQKHKLDTLGLEYPKEINKGEASKLIEENPEGAVKSQEPPEASPTSQDDY